MQEEAGGVTQLIPFQEEYVPEHRYVHAPPVVLYVQACEADVAPVLFDVPLFGGLVVAQVYAVAAFTTTLTFDVASDTPALEQVMTKLYV